MANHQAPPEQLAAQAGEEEFLTVNMVMPAADDTAEGAAGFAHLLLSLAALALARFGAAPENHHTEALRELGPSSLPEVPADPFDGQLLRFRQANSGYQFHSIRPDLTDAPDAKGDPALTIVSSPEVPPLECFQGLAASNP